MSVDLDHVMIVVPLRKPRAKLSAKRRVGSMNGRESQLKNVLAKIEHANDRNTNSLPSLGHTKGKDENQPHVSCLKGYARESLGLVRALEVYSPNNPATAKWRSGLQPLSLYQQSKLEKSVRDYKRLYSVQHSPPHATLTVRWRNNGKEICYTEESLQKIFSHFGQIRKISFQSACSAHIVLENAENACLALGLSNLGFPRCPLHVRWLPEEQKRLLWRKNDAVAEPMKVKNAVINGRNTGGLHEPSKKGARKSPQALMRHSQICRTTPTDQFTQ